MVLAGIGAAQRLTTEAIEQASTGAAENADLRAKVAALEAIIAGRSTPPTDAEFEAHDAAGGMWLCVFEGRPCVAEHQSGARYLRRCGSTRWTALDRSNRPCVWPVVKSIEAKEE